MKIRKNVTLVMTAVGLMFTGVFLSSCDQISGNGPASGDNPSSEPGAPVVSPEAEKEIFDIITLPCDEGVKFYFDYPKNVKGEIKSLSVIIRHEDNSWVNRWHYDPKSSDFKNRKEFEYPFLNAGQKYNIEVSFNYNREIGWGNIEVTPEKGAGEVFILNEDDLTLSCVDNVLKLSCEPVLSNENVTPKYIAFNLWQLGVWDCQYFKNYYNYNVIGTQFDIQSYVTGDNINKFMSFDAEFNLVYLYKGTEYNITFKRPAEYKKLGAEVDSATVPSLSASDLASCGATKSIKSMSNLSDAINALMEDAFIKRLESDEDAIDGFFDVFGDVLESCEDFIEADVGETPVLSLNETFSDESVYDGIVISNASISVNAEGEINEDECKYDGTGSVNISVSVNPEELVSSTLIKEIKINAALNVVADGIKINDEENSIGVSVFGQYGVSGKVSAAVSFNTESGLGGKLIIDASVDSSNGARLAYNTVSNFLKNLWDYNPEYANSYQKEKLLNNIVALATLIDPNVTLNVYDDSGKNTLSKTFDIDFVKEYKEDILELLVSLGNSDNPNDSPSVDPVEPEYPKDPVSEEPGSGDCAAEGECVAEPGKREEENVELQISIEDWAGSISEDGTITFAQIYGRAYIGNGAKAGDKLTVVFDGAPSEVQFMWVEDPYETEVYDWGSDIAAKYCHYTGTLRNEIFEMTFEDDVSFMILQAESDTDSTCKIVSATLTKNQE